jgi:hypothetical protein
MHAEFFTSEALWLAPMQEAFKKVRWGSKNIQITLSPEFAVFRHFLMPFVERRFWKQSIPLEAKKYVPFPFDESVFDFYAYQFHQEDPKSKLGILFGITNKKISKFIENGVKKIGFNLIGIEVSSSSVTRAFGKFGAQGSGGRVFAHFDANVAHLLLTYNGVPMLFREVSFEDAQSTERRRLDVRGSIDFINKQLGATVFNEILLSGLNLDMWKVVLEEDSKLPVKIWDPKSAVKMPEMEWGTLAAIGSTLKFMPGETGLLDLVERVKTTVDEKKAVMLMYAMSCSLAGLILIMSLFSYTRVFVMNRQLATLKKNTPEIPEFENKTTEGIELAVNEVEKKKQKIESMLSATNKFTPKLQAFAESIPNEAWLTSLIYSRQIQGETSIKISGEIKTGDPAQDTAILNTFREQLKRNPAMANFLKPGNKISAPTYNRAKGEGNTSTFNMETSEQTY